MKRSTLIGLLAGTAALAAASGAFASNLDTLVGNTSVCKTADGAATKVNVQAGGAYTVTLPNGQKITGTAVDDGKTITYTDNGAAAGTAPVQIPSTPRKVGDTWTVTAQGASQSCVLVAGAQ